MDFTNLKIFGELDLCASLFIYASIAFTLCFSFFIVLLYKERKKLKATVEAFKGAEETFATKDSYDFYVLPKDFQKLLIEIHYLKERLSEMKEKISDLELGIILSPSSCSTKTEYEYEDIFIDAASSDNGAFNEEIRRPYRPAWEREKADWLLFEKAIGTKQLSALKDEDE